MHALVVAFDKQPEMSTESFRRYYREEHAPIVRDLPNLSGYQVLFPDDPDKSQYDGIAFLQFENASALSEAMASETAELMRADGANFVERESLTQVVGQLHNMLD